MYAFEAAKKSKVADSANETEMKTSPRLTSMPPPSFSLGLGPPLMTAATGNRTNLAHYTPRGGGSSSVPASRKRHSREVELKEEHSDTGPEHSDEEAVAPPPRVNAKKSRNKRKTTPQAAAKREREALAKRKKEAVAKYGLDRADASRPTTTVDMPSSLGEGEETNTDAIVQYAREAGAPMAYKPNQGVQFTRPEHLHEMDEEMSYAGARARQVLHHHSEVMRWALEAQDNPHPASADLRAAKKRLAKKNKKKAKVGDDAASSSAQPPTLSAIKYKPVEVQSFYVRRQGVDGADGVQLSVSANQQSSQAFMANLSHGDLASIYERAAAIPENDAQNGHIGRAARKVLGIQTQNLQRRANAETNARETDDDMRLAEILAAKATNRAAHTVVVNTALGANNAGARHAEQVLAQDYVDRQRVEPGDRILVAGTRIRCGACSVNPHLGPDNHLRDHQQALENSRADRLDELPIQIPNAPGIYHPGNATQEGGQALVNHVVSDGWKMENKLHRRQRSLSLSYFSSVQLDALRASLASSSSSASDENEAMEPAESKAKE